MKDRFVRSFVVVAVIIGAALAVGSAPAGSEAFPGANGKIAFTRETQAGSDIWVMDNDGSNQAQLTDAGGLFDFDPSWSPDGTKLVFVREYPDIQKAFVINADGSGERQLTPDDLDIGVPSWSADGSKVYFNAFPPSNTGSGPAIFSIDADGTNVVQLTTDNDWDRWPSASPDGTRIAFSRQDPQTGADEIWVAGIDGSNPVQLTDSGVTSNQSFVPSWSPDGSRIVYNYRTGDPADFFVRVMNADGSNQTQVFGPGVGWTRWSPDGQRLLLFYADDTDPGIWTIGPDGTGAQLVLAGTDIYDPAWQPIPAPVAPTTTTTSPPAVAAEEITPAFTG